MANCYANIPPIIETDCEGNGIVRYTREVALKDFDRKDIAQNKRDIIKHQDEFRKRFEEENRGALENFFGVDLGLGI
jgi:hypothetical protein